MPIYRLLAGQTSCQPEEVATIGNVYEDVLNELGLIDRTDPLTAMIAKKVIELAEAGVRDPVRLKRLTLQAFNGKPTASSAA
jgi:hypothetical protein